MDKLLGNIRSGFNNKKPHDSPKKSAKQINLEALASAVTVGNGDVTSAIATPPGGELTRQSSFRNSKRGGSVVASRMRAIEEKAAAANNNNANNNVSNKEGNTSQDNEDPKRVRRSRDMDKADTSEDLFDYLLQASDENERMEFERAGSMRRKRNAAKRLSDSVAGERERAPSPQVIDVEPESKKSAERKWRSITEKLDIGKRESPVVSSPLSQSPVPDSPRSPALTGDASRRNRFDRNWKTPTPVQDTDRSSVSSEEAKKEDITSSDEALQERTRRREERRRRSSNLDSIDLEKVNNELNVANDRLQKRNTIGNFDMTKISDKDTNSTIPENKADPSDLTSKTKDTVKMNGELPADKAAEKRAQWKAKRLRSHLDPSELSKALRTIDEKNKTENTDVNSDNKNDNKNELTTLEKHRAKYATKYNSTSGTSNVATFLKQLEENNNNNISSNIKGSVVAKSTDDVFDDNVVFRRTNLHSRGTPITRRWSSAIDKTDVDSVIKSIEQTGREIQSIGLPAEKKQTDARPLGRTVDLINRNVNTTTTTNYKRDKIGEEMIDNSHRKLSNRITGFSSDESNHSTTRNNAVSDIINTKFNNKLTDVSDSDLNSNKTNSVSDHSVRTRRWKSHVEPTEIEKALTLSKDADVKHTAPPLTGWRARVYGETASDTKTTTESLDVNQKQQGRSQSESNHTSPNKMSEDDIELSASITQKAMLEHSSGRWRSNIDKSDVDKAYKTMVESNTSESNNSDSGATTPSTPLTRSNSRRNRSPDKTSPDDPRRWGRYLETFDFDKSENKTIDKDNSYDSAISVSTSGDSDIKATSSPVETKPPSTVTIKKYSWSDIDDVKTSASDYKPRIFLRDRISSVSDIKYNQGFDSSLSQYKTNLSPLDQARKQRTKALAARFATFEDDWSSPVSPPTSSNNTLNKYDRTDKQKEESTTERLGPETLNKNESVLLPEVKPEDESPVVVVDRKHETPSERDDGFETGSDTVSQRTSMSSTLAEELGGTPTMTRRADNLRPKDDLEDEYVASPSSYFAASIDSLVQRPEFANDRKTPTTEDQGKVMPWNDNVANENTQMNIEPPSLRDRQRSPSSEDLSNNKTLTNTPTEEHEVVWTEHPINIDPVTPETPTKPAEETMVNDQEIPPPPPRKNTLDRKGPLRSSVQRKISPAANKSINQNRSSTPTGLNISSSSSRSATPTKFNSINSPRSKSGSNTSIMSDTSNHSANNSPATSKFLRPKKPSSLQTNSSTEQRAPAKPKQVTPGLSRLTAPTASSLTRSQSVRVKKTTPPSQPPSTAKVGMKTISEIPKVPVRTSSMRVTPLEKGRIVRTASAASERSSNASAAPTNDSKSESKMSRFMNKLGTKGKSEISDTSTNDQRPTTPRPTRVSSGSDLRRSVSAVSSRKIGVPRDLPLRKNDPSKSDPNKPKDGATALTVNGDIRKEKSPSLLKKMMKPVDKAPFRKSQLNKSDVSEKQSAAERRKTALGLGKTSAGKISRC